MTNKNILDGSGPLLPQSALWEPFIFTKEEIDAEIERLAAIPKPASAIAAAGFLHESFDEKNTCTACYQFAFYRLRLASRVCMG